MKKRYIRYMALLGMNTKQLWLYDEENDVYIDPPSSVLAELDKILYVEGVQTAESIDAAQKRLEEIANVERPAWLHDGNEYSGDTDI